MAQSTGENKYITDGINYAKSLQAAILPNKEEFVGCFSDSFVFFKPKDIVSGDFYWFKEHGDYYFFAVADCTGHGVPGAMMSMIGNTLLNEILFGKKIVEPPLILKKLHEGVKYALGQAGNSQRKINDGMEITLARIEKKSNELIISSSGQIFFIAENNEIKAYKGDNLFIGSKFLPDEKMIFQEFKFVIQSGLKLFFLTDGLAEQYDNDRKKQFGYKQIKEMLQQEINMPFQSLEATIAEKYEEWKGDFMQMDDVLVIGAKF